MINKVLLIGNLTKDAEPVATAGRSMTKMRLATNHRWRNGDGISQESTEFHTVIAFGKLAENVSIYCQRGTRVYVEGRLRTHQWEAADGSKRYSTEIVADTLKLLSPRHTDAGDDDGGFEGAPLESRPVLAVAGAASA